MYSGAIHRGPDSGCEERRLQRHRYRQAAPLNLDYPGRTECVEVGAGDIAAVVGIDRTDIGDVYHRSENPVEPSPSRSTADLSIVFEASTSRSSVATGHRGRPSAQGAPVHEAENNVTMKIEELEDKSGVEVSGAASDLES